MCSAVADSTACRRPVPHYLASRLNKAVKGKDKPYSNNAHYEQLSLKNKKEKLLESRHIKLISPSMASKHNVVCFLLGDSPASDLYMPTFRNTLSVPSSKAGVK